MSADDLSLLQPQGESFQPDSSLDFVSATPPNVPDESYGAAYATGLNAGTGEGSNAAQETGSWYYPGSVTSRNKLWVQTFSGLKTVAGCSYGGYLPLWSDINSAGNFYVYEWYPGQWTPSVRWWSWTWPGYKKGWFTGDVPGWHILCYNCRDWSNYVYIYVWPSGSGAYSSGYAAGSGYTASSGYSAGTSAAVSPSSASASNPLPSGAPTPPDPNAENLILPDFNLLTPSSGQDGYATSPAGLTGTAAGNAAGAVVGTTAGIAGYSSQAQSAASYPVQGTSAAYSASYPTGYISQTGYYLSTYPANQFGKSVQTSQSCPGCQASAAAGTAAAGDITAQKACAACGDQSGYQGTGYQGLSYQGIAVPSGQTAQAYKAVSTTYPTVSQTCQTVFPKSSTCKCNAYYVQVWPNKLCTEGGVWCGQWLPLWSKVEKPGIYWSFEWTLCGSSSGYFCQPEVKNFGYKNAGWHQTWFRGNAPGWHILSYCTGDYSNYIYIYVWPAS